MTKHCNKCNTTKAVSEFGKNASRQDGLQSQCKTCRKVTNNNHYKNSAQRRKRIRENAKKFSEQSIAYVESLKEAASCPICGESSPCALDFHHKHNEKKEFIISEGKTSYSLNKLIPEINKCIIVCANCHRKIHAGIIPEPTEISKSENTIPL